MLRRGERPAIFILLPQVLGDRLAIDQGRAVTDLKETPSFAELAFMFVLAVAAHTVISRVIESPGLIWQRAQEVNARGMVK